MNHITLELRTFLFIQNTSQETKFPIQNTGKRLKGYYLENISSSQKCARNDRKPTRQMSNVTSSGGTGNVSGILAMFYFLICCLMIH